MEAPLGPSHRQAHRAAMTCWWLWPGLGAYAWRCCPQYPLLPVVHAGQCCHGRARWLECHLVSPAVRHVCQALQLHLLGMAPAGHLGCLVGLGLGCPPASTARSTAVLLRASHVTALACDSRQPDGSHYPPHEFILRDMEGPAVGTDRHCLGQVAKDCFCHSIHIHEQHTPCSSPTRPRRTFCKWRRLSPAWTGSLRAHRGRASAAPVACLTRCRLACKWGDGHTLMKGARSGAAGHTHARACNALLFLSRVSGRAGP